ncbi:MAG: hypothetical protein M1505_00240 [Patescibacteria group bacterium]|nr:hypothetical protein [Patescibacteria group bacterium]MCL5257660.1 hypothetical protein [Patescibacteria group bacterium]
MDQKFQGGGTYKPRQGEEWLCAKCGQAIESLPFDPRRNDDGSLKGAIYHRECLPPRPPRHQFN